MKNVGLFAIILIFIFACGKTAEKNNSLFSVSNNFDSNVSWINVNTITKGLTHSGIFAAKMDTTIEYGIGIGSKFNDLLDKLPKKVNVHCWVYSNTPNIDATLVCDPTINDQSINWQGLNLKDKIIKAKEWTELTTSFDLPKNITPDTKLLVYFWNPNKLIFYVDDLDISLE
jgi:hypothetical protein